MSNPAPPLAKRTYVNPSSIIGTAVTFIVLSVIAVSGRFYVRRFKHTYYGLDDWFALLASFFLILYCATQITAVGIHTEGYHSPPAPHGLASDETALPPIQVRFKKIQYIYNLTFVLLIGFVRLSTLFFYRRIFRGRAFEIAWSIVVTTTSLWMIVFFFTSAFQCGSNFSAFWSSFADSAKHCFNIFGQVVALAVTDLALDVAVLVLPLPFVWELQMPVKQKVGVSFIFLLGLFSVAAAATRTAMNINVNFLHHPGGTAPVLGLRADDVVGIVAFTLFWQLVQSGVAVIASNLLTLRPLYHKLWPTAFLSSLRSQLFSPHGSNVHLRRFGGEDKGVGAEAKDQSPSRTYTQLSGSTQNFAKVSDDVERQQHITTVVPLHALGQKQDEHAEFIAPGKIKVTKDISTTEHV